MRVLSIRQPWAWLIVNRHKDVENRTWSTPFRGRFLVHAGKVMTQREYDECFNFVAGIYHRLSTDFLPPEFAELKQQCGGIVGESEVINCVRHDDSPWFVGEFGFKLGESKPLPFKACKGALGFFSEEVLR